MRTPIAPCLRLYSFRFIRRAMSLTVSESNPSLATDSTDDPLSINKYGIPEPISKKIIYPDVLIIPLVAFDNELNRLGYGGGYYDRYLAKSFKKKKNYKNRNCIFFSKTK